MIGAAAGLLPADLGERLMLGDTGANLLGAVLGLAVVLETSRPVRTGVLIALIVLNLASERVSFTKVIDATPGLRHLDRLGRRRLGHAADRCSVHRELSAARGIDQSRRLLCTLHTDVAQRRIAVSGSAAVGLDVDAA